MSENASQPRKLGPLIGAVVGLAALITFMAMAFAFPAVHSGAHDLAIGVAGPEPAVAKVEAGLAEKSPGTFFEVTRYPDAAALEQAIRDRDVHGGIGVGPDGVTAYTATAGGAPMAQAVRGAATGLSTATGQKLTTVDVVGYTADDPTGAGLSALMFPLSIGGIVPAVVMFNLFKNRRWSRIAAVTGVAVLAGLAVTAVLHFWTGSLGGNYWETAAVLALSTAAISLTALGVESVFGMAGFGVLALLMVFVANPLSGLVAGPDWLPKPLGAIGQLLPPGAGGSAIRAVAFFDGAGLTAPLITLCVWIAAGLLLSVLGHHRSSRRPAPAGEQGTTDAPVSAAVA